MKEKEYIRLKQDAEREYREKIAAIEMVWKMSRQPPKVLLSSVGDSAPRGDLTIAVKKWVDDMSNSFTILDVERFIKPTYPKTNRGSLNNLLRGMVKSGDINILQKSSGRQPTIYENKWRKPKSESQ